MATMRACRSATVLAMLAAISGPAGCLGAAAETSARRVAAETSVPASPRLDAEERAWVRRHGAIRIGVARADWPPFDIVLDGPRLSGISGSYLELVRNRFNLDAQIVVFPRWSEVLAALAAGRIDAVVSVSETPERAKLMAFTRTYFQSTPAVIARNDNSDVLTLDTLVGRRVAIEAGFAPAERLKQSHPGIRLVPSATTLQALVNVAAGEADAYVGNALAAAALIDAHQLTSLQVRAAAAIPGGDMRFGVRPDLPLLTRILEKALASVTADEAAEIQARWTPASAVDIARAGDVPLARGEREWLRAHPTIRLGAAPGGLPWQDFTADGQPVGLATDYARLLERRLGVRIELVRRETWNDVLSATRAGEIDILVAVAQSPSRETFLAFSAPFLETQWALVTPFDGRHTRDLTDLAGRTVAVVSGHVTHEAIRSRHPQITAVAYANVDEALDAVARRKADAAVATLESVAPILLRDHADTLRIAGIVRDPSTGIRIGVRRDWPELVPILNKALASIGPNERAAIHSRWLNVVYRPGLNWQTVLAYAIPSALALLCVLAVVIVWNRRLRREVENRQLAERQLVVARDAAEAASRAKGTFLATMSHEIRTPMNAVLGMMELLARSRLDPEQRRTVATVRESGRSLLTLINDILDFSKIEADKLEIRPQAASIRAVVESTRNVYSGLASDKGLLLATNVEPDVAAAHVFDPLRMRQILNNLASNAVKFTDHGRIDIEVTADRIEGDRQHLVIAVIDTGAGIPADQRAALFQPFHQGRNERGRPGGTGLGLSICRRLAQLMGGALDLDSVPGRGTTVSLRIELETAEPSLVPQVVPGDEDLPFELRTAPTRAQAVDGRSLILVAEDHPTNLRLLLQQLATLGYACDGARDGAEALAHWNSGDYSLLITDCNMPVMDGYELARAIRAAEARRPGAARIPILGCTASALPGERTTCLEAGMDDLLLKPVELRQLNAELARWLPPVASHPTAQAPAERSKPGGAAGGIPIDLDALAASYGPTWKSVLAEFLANNAEDLDRARAASTQGDYRTMGRAAHRVAGAAAVLGARALCGAALQVEIAARREASAGLDQLIECFATQVERVEDHARAADRLATTPTDQRSGETRPVRTA